MMCPICDIQMSSNLIPANKFDLERYFRTFPQNFRTFPQNGKIVWKFVEKTTLYGYAQHCTEIGGEKTSLYGNVRNCTQIGEKTTLYGNVRKSDLVKIWFELASQLDLNCSENVKKILKKLS